MGKRTLILSFLGIALLAATGIYHIFSIRFKIGDVYPAYSSLRTDPLGTKVFFESLSDLKDYNLERDYDSVPKWEGNKYTTLFLLGTHPAILEISNKENRQILSWILSAGTRVVISLSSQKASFLADSIKGEELKKDKKEENNSKKDEKNEDPDTKTDYSLTKLLGFKIAPYMKDQTESAELSYLNTEIDLPKSLKYKPMNYFTDLKEGWEVLYSQKNEPVIIFRKYGQGTIILCADSYMFSNEAMVSHRYPRLLSWLIGPGKKIYFDESHFGIQKKTGIIDLAYKYRLQGVIFVFILLAILYIWKNAIAFVPPPNNSYDRTRIIRADRDYLDGLISLLQRYIPENELIKTCIVEWEKTAVKGNIFPGSSIHSGRDLEQFVKNNERPSQIYNSISKKLKERKTL